MADTAMRFDILQATDVARNEAAKLAFHDIFLDGLTQGRFVLRRKLLRYRARIDAKLLECGLCPRTADTINGGKPISSLFYPEW